jgi:hypothetical protein
MAICSHPKIDEELPLSERSRDALVNSQGEYSTHTGADFGCIHHEPKEIQ